MHVLLVAVFSFLVGAPESHGERDSTEQIRGVWKSFESYYNAGDTEALASLWTADGDLFTLSAGILSGPKEIRAFWDETLAKSYKRSAFSLDIDKIRFVKPDVAVVDGTWTITGKDLPKRYPTKGIYTQVLLKTDTGWKIVAARPSVPRQGHTRNLGRTATP